MRRKSNIEKKGKHMAAFINLSAESLLHLPRMPSKVVMPLQQGCTTLRFLLHRGANPPRALLMADGV